jgi:hypothetical protein
MKSRIPKTIKLVLLSFALFSAKLSYSALYTATSSGVWSDNSIWLGGSSPAYNNQIDQIVIASGVTVTLDDHYEMDGLLATLTIDGTLETQDEKNFFITRGTLGGGGSIDADNVKFGAAAIILFGGSFKAEDMEYSMLTLNLSGSLDVTNSMRLSDGVLSLGSGSSLNLSDDATLIISGGILSNSGGTFNGNKYNVTYLNLSSDLTAGAELQGSGLNDVTFDQGDNRSIFLKSALLVRGKLTLNSGTLDLDDNDLEIHDLASGGTGTIRTTSKSSIKIVASSSLAGTLRFKGTSNSMDNFSVDLGNNNNSVTLSGNVKINGTLTLSNGNLILDGSDLDIAGNFSNSGNGTMSSSSNSSNIRISSATSLAGALRFHNTNHKFNNFDLDITDGGSVELGSDLEITGMLILTLGTLNINNHHLMLSGNLSATGNGRFGTSSGSDLTLKTTTSLTGKLRFNNTSNTMRNLTINVGDNNNATLSNDLKITGMLTLTSGRLILDQSANLELAGTLANSGNGSLTSDNSNNIMINTASSLNGMLRFSNGGNSVNNFGLNIADGSNFDLGSDLMIHGTLNFIKGRINVGENSLKLGTTGKITGYNNNSYIVTGVAGSLSIGLTSGSDSLTTYPVGTSDRYFPARIRLNSGSNSGNIMVGVRSNVYADGNSGTDLSITGKVVDGTWNISSDINSNLDLNLQVMWSASAEVNSFNRSSAYIGHYTSGIWDAGTKTSASTEANGMFSLSRNNITSLSPFAVFEEASQTAIAELSVVNIRVYPNPATTTLSVDQTETISPIQLMNAGGQVISSTETTEAHTSIDIATLPAGVYFIKVGNAVGKFTKM